MAYLGRRGALAPVSTADIPDNSITSAKIVDGAVAVADLGPDSVDSSELVDGSIDTSHIADDQVTLAKMAGGTDGQIITYDASGDPVAVGPGTDGQVLTSTGAGSPPAFETIPADGFTHIETLTASGTPTEMHIEDCFTSTYTNYLLQVSDYLQSVDGQDTKLYFSTGGTPNTGSYYWYTWAAINTSNGDDYRLNAKDVAFVYMNPNSANDDAGCSGTWFIHQPKTTDGYAMGHGLHGVDHNGGYFVAGAHHFGWRGTTAFDGIKISVGSGTIGNGAKMAVYGINGS